MSTPDTGRPRAAQDPGPTEKNPTNEADRSDFTILDDWTLIPPTCAEKDWFSTRIEYGCPICGEFVFIREITLPYKGTNEWHPDCGRVHLVECA